MIKGKELNLILKAIGKDQIKSEKFDDFQKLCKANGMTPKEVFAHFIDLESVEGTLSSTEKGDTK